MTGRFYSILISEVTASRPNQAIPMQTWGVGFYIKNNLGYIHRLDLSAQVQHDYESLWIEIQNDTGYNTICGVFCRHHHGNLNNFLNHLNMIVDKIHREKKYCVLSGDFNLDLLKFESHLSTENFLNTLGSYYFQPQILQPNKNDRSLSNSHRQYFFNCLEHFSISGNLCYDLFDHLPTFLIVTFLSTSKHQGFSTRLFKLW